ncbi:hypothetical protein [Saccharopolyspora sp. 5N708]|uniref:hypothetical protein n=1 Tax=Saccharopolyspora sp. 5N708 TaxID=3457424 RepID=UPI003FD574BA
MRVAIAEDGALFREGLVMLLDAAGHEVVTCVADGDTLFEAPETSTADVAVWPGSSPWSTPSWSADTGCWPGPGSR